LKSYTYYPGCCLSPEGYAKAFGWSNEAVNKMLGLEFTELKDWNCCGSTPYSSMDELSFYCLCTRNLALAEKKGLDLVAPCSSCYVSLSRANRNLKKYPQLKAKVDAALAAAGLEYHGTVRVRKVLDVYVNDAGYDAIAAKVKRNLGGLKVACYYGCQEVRPEVILARRRTSRTATAPRRSPA
jgi:heterodisulfide reductase subunit B